MSLPHMHLNLQAIKTATSLADARDSSTLCCMCLYHGLDHRFISLRLPYQTRLSSALAFSATSPLSTPSGG